MEEGQAQVRRTFATVSCIGIFAIMALGGLLGFICTCYKKTIGALPQLGYPGAGIPQT
jgi:hypothetical protein